MYRRHIHGKKANFLWPENEANNLNLEKCLEFHNIRENQV